MCNGTTHQIAAAAVVGIGCLAAESGQTRKTEKPLIGAILAAGFTKLPDVLEPAIHPNHRQFFHGVAFAGMLGVATHKMYCWKPDNPTDETVRFLLLVCASAYFIHLMLDAGTPKSLPLIGRL